MVVIASLITASVGNKGPSESSPSIEPTSGRGQTLQHRLQTHRQVEVQPHILQLLEANHHRPCATPPFQVRDQSLLTSDGGQHQDRVQNQHTGRLLLKHPRFPHLVILLQIQRSASAVDVLHHAMQRIATPEHFNLYSLRFVVEEVLPDDRQNVAQEHARQDLVVVDDLLPLHIAVLRLLQDLLRR